MYSTFKRFLLISLESAPNLSALDLSPEGSEVGYAFRQRKKKCELPMTVINSEEFYLLPIVDFGR